MGKKATRKYVLAEVNRALDYLYDEYIFPQQEQLNALRQSITDIGTMTHGRIGAVEKRVGDVETHPHLNHAEDSDLDFRAVIPKIGSAIDRWRREAAERISDL